MKLKNKFKIASQSICQRNKTKINGKWWKENPKGLANLVKDEMNSIIRLWLNHAITWSVWFSWNIKKNDSFPNTSYQPVPPIKIKHLVMNQNFNAVPGTCTRFRNEAEFSSLRYLCVIREANDRGVVLYCLSRGGTKHESCTHTWDLQFKTRPRLGSTIIAHGSTPGQASPDNIFRDNLKWCYTTQTYQGIVVSF